MTGAAGRVLIVTGLPFEARAAAAVPQCHVIQALGAKVVESLDALGPSPTWAGIVSFGTAGGLAPDCRPGDLVIATSVLDAVVDTYATAAADADADAGSADIPGMSRTSQTSQASQASGSNGARFPTDSGWRSTLSRQFPDWRPVTLLGAPTPVVTAAAKAMWRRRTGAAAVDMESHHIARYAAARGIPFIACRVVIDSAHVSLPPAALAGMRPDGSTAVGAVLLSLLRQPQQLPALLRLGRDASRAQRALAEVARQMPPRFGLSGDAPDAH